MSLEAVECAELVLPKFAPTASEDKIAEMVCTIKYLEEAVQQLTDSQKRFGHLKISGSVGKHRILFEDALEALSAPVRYSGRNPRPIHTGPVDHTIAQSVHTGWNQYPLFSRLDTKLIPSNWLPVEMFERGRDLPRPEEWEEELWASAVWTSAPLKVCQRKVGLCTHRFGSQPTTAHTDLPRLWGNTQSPDLAALENIKGNGEMLGGNFPELLGLYREGYGRGLNPNPRYQANPLGAVGDKKIRGETDSQSEATSLPSSQRESTLSPTAAEFVPAQKLACGLHVRTGYDWTKVRAVVMRLIPAATTIAEVLSNVRGGQIERVECWRDERMVTIFFMAAGAARSYVRYVNQFGGVYWKGYTRQSKVELAHFHLSGIEEVEPTLARAVAGEKATRILKIMGLGDDITEEKLTADIPCAALESIEISLAEGAGDTGHAIIKMTSVVAALEARSIIQAHGRPNYQGVSFTFLEDECAGDLEDLGKKWGRLKEYDNLERLQATRVERVLQKQKKGRRNKKSKAQKKQVQLARAQGGVTLTGIPVVESAKDNGSDKAPQLAIEIPTAPQGSSPSTRGSSLRSSRNSANGSPRSSASSSPCTGTTPTGRSWEAPTLHLQSVNSASEVSLRGK